MVLFRRLRFAWAWRMSWKKRRKCWEWLSRSSRLRSLPYTPDTWILDFNACIFYRKPVNSFGIPNEPTFGESNNSTLLYCLRCIRGSRWFDWWWCYLREQERDYSQVLSSSWARMLAFDQWSSQESSERKDVQPERSLIGMKPYFSLVPRRYKTHWRRIYSSHGGYRSSLAASQRHIFSWLRVDTGCKGFVQVETTLLKDSKHVWGCCPSPKRPWSDKLPNLLDKNLSSASPVRIRTLGKQKTSYDKRTTNGWKGNYLLPFIKRSRTPQPPLLRRTIAIRLQTLLAVGWPHYWVALSALFSRYQGNQISACHRW